jgi:hypothetical protein
MTQWNKRQFDRHTNEIITLRAQMIQIESMHKRMKEQLDGANARLGKELEDAAVSLSATLGYDLADIADDLLEGSSD